MIRRLTVMAAVILAVLATAVPAQATHAWGDYHWARTANPFTVEVDNNLTADWQAKLTTAVADWSASSVLDIHVNTGSFGDKSTCDPQLGHVEVCNAKFGTTGWTGMASIYFDANHHIIRGFAVMNDTYLSRGSYPDAYDQLTICQEIGHNFGLLHQDEVSTNPNLGTCMDYTNDADGPPSNEHPNAHDYEQLESIYSHLDPAGFTTGGGVITFVAWA